MTYQILKTVITHALAVKNSLPYGGELLNANGTVAMMYRYLGLPPMEYNSLTPLTRLFPYNMELFQDKIIIHDVESPEMPVFDVNGKMINHKLKNKSCDIMLKGYSLTSLPDPGKANFMLPTDFLARLKGDYSITWSIYRESRQTTRKRLNANRRTFEFLVDVPFLGKRLFSEDAIEIKKKMFKFADVNAQLGSFGDLYRVATHVLLRKAIPHEHIAEQYAYLRKEDTNLRGLNITEKPKEYVDKAKQDSELRDIIYKDDRTFTIQTDYFRKIGGGISAIEEKDSLPEIFFNSMYPFSFKGWDLLERYQPLYSASLGAFLPFYNEPEGVSEPGLILETYSGVYNLNHFALPGAKNYAVIGATGSGKTFFQVNRNIVGYGKGTRIIFVDRGGALFRAVKFLNGQNIKLRMSYDYDSIKDKLNPFVLASPDVFSRKDDYDEYKQSIREFMVTLLCSICQRENDNIAIRYFTTMLDDMIFKDFNKNKVISEATGEASAQVTFSDIYKYLYEKKNETGWSELLSNDTVLSSISLYTKGQLYGSLFDGLVRKPLITSPAVAIDFEGLESDNVAQVSLAIINSYIWNVVLGTGGFIPALNKKFRFTDIALDEVWGTLKTNLGQKVIEVGMRTLRKHGAGMGILTQTASDIGNSPIKDAILNNIQNLYVLSSNEADVINYKNIFNFNDIELAQIKNLKSDFGYYNDIYYKYLGNSFKHLSTFVKLRPIPLSYAIVTSDADDKTVMNYLQEEFVNECGDSENISYMKAVLLFSKLFPNSVRRYPKYAEIMNKKGNNLIQFTKSVLTDINFNFKEFNLEKELLDINLNVESILN
jgi:conjugal transfer ATP-binding protein TraC